MAHVMRYSAVRFSYAKASGKYEEAQDTAYTVLELVSLIFLTGKWNSSQKGILGDLIKYLTLITAVGCTRRANPVLCDYMYLTFSGYQQQNGSEDLRLFEDQQYR